MGRGASVLTRSGPLPPGPSLGCQQEGEMGHPQGGVLPVAPPVFLS